MTDPGTRRPPGVYRVEADGSLGALVHGYIDDGYELADVHALLGIGAVGDDGGTLVLTRHELRQLRVAADAHSFDHAEAFISLCVDVAALDPGPGAPQVTLASVG